MIDKGRLIRGKNIYVNGIGTFKQMSLDVIFEDLDIYYSYLNFIVVSIEDYLKSIKQEELISGFKQHGLTMLDICTNNEEEKQWLIDALSYFFVGEVYFDSGFILKSPDQECLITRDNFPIIKNVIKEINGLKVDSKEEETYSNDKAREIAEKLKKAKEEISKNSKDGESTKLDCITSSVSARHPSLNLLNIWDLTVYQLYDQYNRLTLVDSFNIGSMHYANWGGEFKSSWSKNIE